MFNRKVSTMTFYAKDGRILLQDRTGISKFGEEWAFFGGAIEKGETPEQALKREIKEELCFDLTQFERLGKYDGYPAPGFRTLQYAFVAPLPSLSSFSQQEGKGMQLFSLEEAKKLRMLTVDLPVLNDFEKYWKRKISR